MQVEKLSHAVVIQISESIYELTIEEGIELDLKSTIEFHEFLLGTQKDSVYILINQKNNYTYSFQAMTMLGCLDMVRAMAFYTPSRVGYIGCQLFFQVPRILPIRMEVFSNHFSALSWLEKQEDSTYHPSGDECSHED